MPYRFPTLARKIGKHRWYSAEAWACDRRWASRCDDGRIGNTDVRLSSSASFVAMVSRSLVAFFGGKSATMASTSTRYSTNDAWGGGSSSSVLCIRHAMRGNDKRSASKRGELLRCNAAVRPANHRPAKPSNPSDTRRVA